MASLDKTSPNYWSDIWTATGLPPSIDLSKAPYITRKYHEAFAKLLTMVEPRGELLEIGCASSVWLPHLAKEFGLSVSGIDYSEEGCRKAREILTREGVPGKVYFADALAPNAELTGRFDVVLSMGVVEHFTDTAQCLESLARYLKPGGLLITSIPNMAGWIGTVQKVVNRPVYDVHIPLDREMLKAAAQRAGLTVTYCDYLGSSDFHMCNLWGMPANTRGLRARQLLLAILMRVSRAIWLMERIIPIQGGRRLAPAIVCAARTEQGTR